MVVARRFRITNRAGMHAHAASAFVHTARAFIADIWVEKEGMCADGKAVIELLTLVAAAGSLITVRGRGPDAEQALKALGRLIEDGFGGRAICAGVS